MSYISAIVSLEMPRSTLLSVGISDAPEAEPHGQTAASQCEPVGSFVAFETFRTRHLPIMHIRVMIVDMAVKKIEDVTKDDGGQSHCAPVLRQAVDTESLGNERCEYPIEEPISH